MPGLTSHVVSSDKESRNPMVVPLLFADRKNVYEATYDVEHCIHRVADVISRYKLAMTCSHEAAFNLTAGRPV